MDERERLSMQKAHLAAEAHAERQRGWNAAKEWVKSDPYKDDVETPNERLRIPTQFLTGSREFQQGWSDFMEGRPTA